MPSTQVAAQAADLLLTAQQEVVSFILGIKDLEQTLQDFQEQLKTTEVEQRQQYSATLDTALTSLMQLVQAVDKVDDDVVIRSNELQHAAMNGTQQIGCTTALGIDENNAKSHVIPKKIQPITFAGSCVATISSGDGLTAWLDPAAQIQKKVQELSKVLNGAHRLFHEQLEQIEGFSMEITQSSISKVARVLGVAEQLREECDIEIERVNNEMKIADVELKGIQQRISEAKNSILDSNRRENSHEVARNVGIATSTVGGLAALGSIALLIFAPPLGVGAVLATTAALGGGGTVSVASGVIAAANDKDIDNLRARRSQLETEESELLKHLTTLRDAKSTKDTEIIALKQTISSLSHINVECKTLQMGFSTIQDDLRGRLTVFSELCMKIGDLATELEMCEFAETRKEMVSRLKDMLERLIGLGYDGQ